MLRTCFRKWTAALRFGFVLAVGLGAYVSAFQPAAAGSVGTAEQLDAGRTAYRTHCAGCHAGDLGGRGETPPLCGDAFLQAWRTRTIADFYQYIQGMPPEVVYPSAGYHGKKGVLVGYYIQGQSGRPTGDPAERQALALEQSARIHPQYPAEFETGFSVAWHRVAWNKGSWSSASNEARKILSQPERRVYFAGDHLNMNAWMQGAFESARQVATALHARAGSARRLSASVR